MVYFIQAGTDGPIKIGFSKNPQNRLRELQTSHHERLRILVAVDGTVELEAALHVYFVQSRLEGEWFDLESSDVIEIVSQIISDTFSISEKQTKTRFQEIAKVLRAPVAKIDFELIKEIFGSDKKVPSSVIAEAHNCSAKQLSNYLATFGIKPRPIRLGNEVMRGYIASDFAHIWKSMENPFLAKQITNVTL